MTTILDAPYRAVETTRPFVAGRWVHRLECGHERTSGNKDSCRLRCYLCQADVVAAGSGPLTGHIPI